MKEKSAAAVAYAAEQVKNAAAIFEAAGIDSKAINLILIGLAGVKKSIKGQKEKEK